jgi:hypothetical protein
VPTAKSAASDQPSTTTSPTRALSRLPRVARFPRLTQLGLASILGITALLPVQLLNAPLVAASASPNCPGWNSTTRPPDYIRVLRRQSGRVDRVPFKKYVLTVLGKEWPGYLPHAVIEAGAVAVKQYAWYHALGNGRVSSHGQCFDVTDGTGDQLYKPGKARIRADHYTALDATWGVRLMKQGSLFMTGYRTGLKGACGHDATGWKLFARSATRCAERGDGFLAILHIYYGPVAVVSGGGSSSAADGSSFQTINFDAPATTDSSASTDSGASTDSSASTDTSASSSDSRIYATPPVTTPDGVTDAAVVTAAAGLTGGVGMGGTDTPAEDVPAPANVLPVTPDDPASDYVPIGGLAFTAG